jgi:hypothetical protein
MGDVDTMTDAHDAKAREIAADIDCHPSNTTMREVLIAAALRDCERETIERAAKVALECSGDEMDIAERIRALAQEEPK